MPGEMKRKVQEGQAIFLHGSDKWVFGADGVAFEEFNELSPNHGFPQHELMNYIPLSLEKILKAKGLEEDYHRFSEALSKCFVFTMPVAGWLPALLQETVAQFRPSFAARNVHVYYCHEEYVGYGENMPVSNFGPAGQGAPFRSQQWLTFVDKDLAPDYRDEFLR